MNEKEHFNLPRIKFHEDFKKKKFDKEMALCLVGELQMHWCQYCDNYKDNNCGCYLPPFKKEMIHKINEHFDNPPLKFEELKEGMWVWDNYDKTYKHIKRTGIWYRERMVSYHEPVGLTMNADDDGYMEDDVFKEGRFFAREAKE